MSDKCFGLKSLAELVDAEYVGDGQITITGLATLQSACATDLSFYTNRRYKKHLNTTDAAAVLLITSDEALFKGNKLLSDEPYLTFAKLTKIFNDPEPSIGELIHPSAILAPDIELEPNVAIGSNVVIESGCKIEADCRIQSNSYIGPNVRVGSNTHIFPNVTIYRNTNIGRDCIIHSGVVLGADGFGFAPSNEGWQKIYQLGGVCIGNQVEIGANSCIDRGALDNTIIESGVKIDNQVQIAHNVIVGENTAIAGAAAIAGSTVIGKRCTIAGAAGIVGHLTIADDVHITAMSLVTKSIQQSGSYSSGTPLNDTRQWRKNAARFNHLDSLVRQLKYTTNKV